MRGAGARALLAVLEHIFAERPVAATTGRGGAGQRQRKRAELAADEEKAQASRDVVAGRPGGRGLVRGGNCACRHSTEPNNLFTAAGSGPSAAGGA